MISSSVIEFLLIPGVPPWGVADGCMGVRVGMGVWGVSNAHTHAHACTHTGTCMLNMLNMDASMLVAICNFYTCIHVHTCMCICACVCVYMHVGHPPCPQTPPTHLPPPQSCREPKTPKFNRS